MSSALSAIWRALTASPLFLYALVMFFVIALLFVVGDMVIMQTKHAVHMMNVSTAQIDPWLSLLGVSVVALILGGLILLVLAVLVHSVMEVEQ